MVIRWRTISQGYYDFQIRRYVEPISLQQAAENLNMRHTMLTGEEQCIEKKTLDDYYDKIQWGMHEQDPFNF